VRFLADENLVGHLVRELRSEGYDVTWIREIAPATDDGEILEISSRESRILLTQDWDFGELAVRDRKAAAGIVIVAADTFHGPLDAAAKQVARRLAELGDSLSGHLTVIGPTRTRQRRLASPNKQSKIENG
jgi:predicted nuclease of predicted toxin-antitoxin system